MERVWSFWWIPLQQKLVGLKNMIVKMGSSSPIFRGENSKTYLSCHHPTTPTSFRNWDFPWSLNMFIVRFLIIVKEFHHFLKGGMPTHPKRLPGTAGCSQSNEFTAWVSFKAVTLHRGIGLDHVMLADTWNGTLWVQRVGAFFLYGANKV